MGLNRMMERMMDYMLPAYMLVAFGLLLLVILMFLSLLVYGPTCHDTLTILSPLNSITVSCSHPNHEMIVEEKRVTCICKEQ